MYTDDAVLLAGSEEELGRMVISFSDVCRRRMWKVNASLLEG